MKIKPTKARELKEALEALPDHRKARGLRHTPGLRQSPFNLKAKENSVIPTKVGIQIFR